MNCMMCTLQNENCYINRDTEDGKEVKPLYKLLNGTQIQLKPQ